MSSTSRTTCIGLLICLTVVFVWFSPWWLCGRTLAPVDLLNTMMQPWREENEHAFAKNHIVADGVDQYLVYRMIAAENFRKEGWVGWSSLTYGGVAQYANTMALYYDWTMQLHRWFDFWTAWNLGIMGQVIIAAAGMLMFLRGRSISLPWACCGALAYAANSQFATWIYHRWTLGAFCWLPWILWAIDSWRRGNRSRWALVPVFIAMGFLGGTLQHAGLLVLAVSAMWVEEAAATERSFRPQIRLLFRYLSWGLAGAGLAAMMFLPCIAAFLESNRLGLHTGTYGHAENGIYPGGHLQPLLNLAAYPLQAFPSVLGRCNSVDVLKLFKSEQFYIAYFGSLPVLIGFLCIFQRKTGTLAKTLSLTGLVLPLTPLVRVLYQRLFILFIIGGILSFACFMETATRELRLRVFRVLSYLSGAAVLLWTAASIWLVAHPGTLTALRLKMITEGKGSSFGYYEDWIGTRVDHFIGDLYIWSPQQIVPLALFAAGLAGLRLTASVCATRRRLGGFLTAAAVVCEVSLFASRWVVFADPQKYPLFPETPEVAALREKVGPQGRVTTLIHPEFHMAKTPFVPNTLAPYGIATISGYDSIVPDGMILPVESPGDAQKLGRFGVSHLVTYPGNPDVNDDWALVWKSKSMEIYQNIAAIPRYISFSADSDLANFFNTGAKTGWVQAQETKNMENTRLVKAEIGSRWIRVAENQASGWEYQVGTTGSEPWKPVSRAADASMLLDCRESPITEKTVIRMRYAPPLRKMGFAISAFTGLLIAIISALLFRSPAGQRSGDHSPA